MARKPDGGSSSPRYFLGFGFTAVLLTGATLLLVLVVLPRRYVLNAGLRESGVSFPSEAAPFLPPEELRTEAPPRPPPPPPVLPGPAELFWARIGPLLETEQYPSALPFFEEYLEVHPEDLGATKEYAITLQKAGEAAQALSVYERLLSGQDDPGVRLLLARGLRDLGQTEAASAHYEILIEQDPQDTSLALEFGRALSWGRRYTQAAEVLTRALERDPSSAELRVELAQVFYSSGRLDDADELLEGIDRIQLVRLGATSLHADIISALTPPEDPAEQVDSVPPSALDRAARVMALEDYESAAVFFRVALREDPEDARAWKAYADLLQYQLEDLDGARSALLELEALGERDQALQFRLAQLETWTGRNDDATARLEGLLGTWDSGLSLDQPTDSARFGPTELAEARALLGDLHRWDGDRRSAAEAYRLALEGDGGNERAALGLHELESETEREIEDVEQPNLGGDGYSLADSDEFTRLDFGVGGVSIVDRWVWGLRSGTRWLGGVDLLGAEDRHRGFFLEVESARWWNWGRLRTGIHFGIEEIRPDRAEYAFGASLRFADLGGFRADFRYDHGPAYPLTLTFQSVLAEVTQDRLTANLSRRLGQRWSLSAAADATRLSHGKSGDGESYRFEGGLSLGKSLTDNLILGANGRALTYSAASPVNDGLRLFWDPRALFAGGIYAQWERNLGERWAFRSRVNPSFALVDERTTSGYEGVPHFSAEAGFSRRGEGLRASIDAFYYQGRFDGYRAYGIRFSLSAVDWFRRRREQ